MFPAEKPLSPRPSGRSGKTGKGTSEEKKNWPAHSRRTPNALGRHSALRRRQYAPMINPGIPTAARTIFRRRPRNNVEPGKLAERATGYIKQLAEDMKALSSSGAMRPATAVFCFPGTTRWRRFPTSPSLWRTHLPRAAIRGAEERVDGCVKTAPILRRQSGFRLRGY
jgi:hypothetical protein